MLRTQTVFTRGALALWPCLLATLVSSTLSPVVHAATTESASLRDRLHALPYKLAYETYVEDNWEIFVSNADGSHAVNLTHTPGVHEHYPQVSPDGRQVCFSVDVGEGREAVRSLWVMDLDGTHRRKLVDGAREPFWSPDSRRIGRSNHSARGGRG